MYWWRENIGALPIPSRDQGVLKLVGDVCEMAICLAWMCADRAGINSFCRELFAVQAAIPSFASALKKSPTDQLVAQVELSQDQIRMALEWSLAFRTLQALRWRGFWGTLATQSLPMPMRSPVRW